jgi:hypothetical protein
MLQLTLKSIDGQLVPNKDLIQKLINKSFTFFSNFNKELTISPYT